MSHLVSLPELQLLPSHLVAISATSEVQVIQVAAELLWLQSCQPASASRCQAKGTADTQLTDSIIGSLFIFNPEVTQCSLAKSVPNEEGHAIFCH